MIVHQIFAQIVEDEVKNIIVCDNYELANYIARATYGDTAFAVDCLQYTCEVGDSYKDGDFYKKEGSKIPRTPTELEEIQQLKLEGQTKDRTVTDLQVALVEQFESNLTLQEEITSTQLALVEIYEKMEV